MHTDNHSIVNIVTIALAARSQNQTAPSPIKGAETDGSATEIEASNPHDSNERIETDNGEYCVFPFVHRGITYFHCTSDDDPKGNFN